jgi:ornithine cyclodeaminase
MHPWTGSLLATRLLLSVRDPSTFLAFGAGKQIEAHVDLHLRAYSTIETCTIVNKSNNQRLVDLIIRLKSAHPTVTFQSLILKDDLARLEQVTRAANIICTATSSKEPLFEAKWVFPGTHLNLIGSYTPDMAEVSSELLHQAGKVVVDSREACASEAGELIKARFNEGDMVEIGTLVHFDSNSPDADYEKVHALCDEVRRAGKITIFKSVGVGLQDVAITNMVVNLAGEIGTRIDSYD